MENKINIAELLKDCPTGMELDCTCANNVVFDKIIEYEQIKCVIGDCHKPLILDKYGRLLHICCPKCVIFPKGKTTWEGFQRPFKDGDIIFTHANCIKVGLGNTWISIYQEKRNGGFATYVDYAEDGDDYYDYIDGDKPLLCMEKDVLRQRLATEEEKAKLFQVIKENGYKWNDKTKTLEKLIEPKFKVGDKVVKKGSVTIPVLITNVGEEFYSSSTENSIGFFSIKDQDYWELVPNKFDISTLKPFDKVLCRMDNDDIWGISLFESYAPTNPYPFFCIQDSFSQCIPYEQNKHLLGTTNDCDEFYKTWE